MSGRNRSWLSLWLLAAAVALATAVGSVMLIPRFGKPPEYYRRRACSDNLRSLGQAIANYSARYNTFPNSVNDLVSGSFIHERALHCPGDPGKALSYRLVPGTVDDASDVIALESPENHGSGGHLLFGDGHVEWRDSRDVEQTMKSRKGHY